MSEPIWNKFLTERDKAVFGTSGYGARGGFGKRPALIVIDVNWAFCGDRPEPILESIKRWRNSCGEDAWTALPYIRALIDKCHAKGIPVIYTTGVRRDDNWDSGGWLWKNSRGNEDRQTIVSNLDGNEIVTPIAPAPQDIVVLKQKPSGFFGSNMASYLTLLGCDSLIVTGTTTSGCVRATVLDGFSLNYRIALAEEGCFDRSQASHAINLCDMNAKYADVMKTDEVLALSSTRCRAACTSCPRAKLRRSKRPSAPRISDAGLIRAMRRAREIKTAGAWNAADAIDCVTLDAHGRHRRRIVLTGERGTTFLLDLPHAIALRDGDGLLLDDGAMVRVAGHAEPLD